jgi:hypothetical protein
MMPLLPRATAAAGWRWRCCACACCVGCCSFALYVILMLSTKRGYAGNSLFYASCSSGLFLGRWMISNYTKQQEGLATCWLLSLFLSMSS